MASSPQTTIPSVACYQQLLSSALQQRNAQGALAAVPMIVSDPALAQGGVSLKLANLAFSIAAGACDPRSTVRLSVAPRTCVVAYQPWFGFDYIKLLRLGLEQGVLMAIFAGVRGASARRAIDFSPEEFRSYCYKGINLWSLCRYNLAVSERTLPDDITCVNPSTWAAVQKTYVQAMGLIDEAADFLRAYQPESVIVAQGYHLLAAVLRRLCVDAGIRVVALENTFHREKLLWEDLSGISVNQTLAKNYYWRYVDGVSEHAARSAAEHYIRSIHSFKSTEHTSPTASTMPLPDGAGPLIVYLGQVSTDASVLFGRRDFKSQVEAILSVANYALEHEVRLIVKLHPKEGPLHNVSEPFYRGLTIGWLEREPAFQRIVQQLGGRLIVDSENSYNTYELIRRADVCVTINSQSGLEALLHDKEVILCGDAAFGGLGFTHEAVDAASMRFTLDRVLRDGARCNDGVRCRKFFHIFTNYYCCAKEEETLVGLAKSRPAYPPVMGSDIGVPTSVSEVPLCQAAAA